jgi:hypothetical protein
MSSRFLVFGRRDNHGESGELEGYRERSGKEGGMMCVWRSMRRRRRQSWHFMVMFLELFDTLIMGLWGMRKNVYACFINGEGKSPLFVI